MKYDLYDFDKTVYPHDSETVFLVKSMLKRPWLWFLAPYQAVCITLFMLGYGDKYKGKCFVFLRFTDCDKLVKKFWEKEEKKIYPFFTKENRGFPTLVCSASPEFLVEPICRKYGVEKVIATRIDKKGRMHGRNCKDDEKVNRIRKAMPDAEFRKVFSDNLSSDIHIFRIGEICFHADKGTLTEMTLEEIEKKINE